MLSLPLLLLLLWSMGSHGFPVSPETQGEDVELVQKYLENYYNLNKRMHVGKQKRSVNNLAELLKQMQKFFGLKVTGKPDNETLKVMKQPRCGVPDVALFTTMPGGPRWNKKDLTYRIKNFTPDLPRSVVENAFEKAFRLWSDVSPLTFTRIFWGEADIMISFTRGAHGDNNPFDGPGDTLAHAFGPGPRLGGDAHFDEDEMWSNENIREINLYLTAAHEFGHSLGLGHSSDTESLMYPVYSYNGNVQLGQDDIDGIQKLYGPPKIPLGGEEEKLGLKAPDVCNSQVTFDAVTTLRGEIMFFKKRFYLRLRPSYLEAEIGFTAAFWPHLANGFDAAYELDYKDEIRFFKGYNYWAVQGQNALPRYPRSIYHSFGFPRTVKQIDAATSDVYTWKTYFFVANKYWRYDEYRQSMDRGYPKMIAHDFPGIGNKVDAVFSKDGFFYFFHGTNQYKFNMKTKQVTILKSNSWFNCRGY
ncbi:interstitial collagenase [Heterocephalus glaber]|uniref:Interstitial collagenase n=1 Tax=Heterocephalus glaber TaxID=10181 RepID=A0AAX6S857_HETGA|nr:interstitial collagenase [Heterocephalus glaber]